MSLEKAGPGQRSEPRERWGTGDSAIEAYARELTALLPCANLRELEAALKHVA